MTDEFNDEQDVAGIRKALEKANKELAAFKAQERERQTVETLSAKGFSPKVAKFIPPDADVDEWLTENADLFGSAPKADEGEQAPPAVESSQGEATEPHPAAADFQAAADLVQDSTPRASESPVIQKLHDAAGSMGPREFEEFARSLINTQPSAG